MGSADHTKHRNTIQRLSSSDKSYLLLQRQPFPCRKLLVQTEHNIHSRIVDTEVSCQQFIWYDSLVLNPTWSHHTELTWNGMKMCYLHIIINPTHSNYRESTWYIWARHPWKSKERNKRNESVTMTLHCWMVTWQMKNTNWSLYYSTILGSLFIWQLSKSATSNQSMGGQNLRSLA